MRYECEQVELKRKDDGTDLYLTKFWCPASWQDKNILMVHGLTYTQHVFDIKYKDYSVCEYFAKNGYTVWRLDLSGYGKSGKYEDGWKVTTQHAAEDEIYALEKICELQGVEKLDLLGWSWGTMTTSKVASQRPDLLKKVVWLGPCFGGAFEATLVTELHGMWVDHTYAQDGGHGRPNGGAKEIMEIGDGWLIDTKAVKLLHLHGAGHAMYLEKDYYQTTREAILKFISE